jgi:tetratricopeptide (TPR) repeat protein
VADTFGGGDDLGNPGAPSPYDENAAYDNAGDQSTNSDTLGNAGAPDPYDEGAPSYAPQTVSAQPDDLGTPGTPQATTDQSTQEDAPRQPRDEPTYQDYREGRAYQDVLNAEDQGNQYKTEGQGYSDKSDDLKSRIDQYAANVQNGSQARDPNLEGSFQGEQNDLNSKYTDWQGRGSQVDDTANRARQSVQGYQNYLDAGASDLGNLRQAANDTLGQPGAPTDGQKAGMIGSDILFNGTNPGRGGNYDVPIPDPNTLFPDPNDPQALLTAFEAKYPNSGPTAALYDANGQPNELAGSYMNTVKAQLEQDRATFGAQNPQLTPPLDDPVSKAVFNSPLGLPYQVKDVSGIPIPTGQIELLANSVGLGGVLNGGIKFAVGKVLQDYLVEGKNNGIGQFVGSVTGKNPFDAIPDNSIFANPGGALALGYEKIKQDPVAFATRVRDYLSDPEQLKNIRQDIGTQINTALHQDPTTVAQEAGLQKLITNTDPAIGMSGRIQGAAILTSLLAGSIRAGDNNDSPLASFDRYMDIGKHYIAGGVPPDQAYAKAFEDIKQGWAEWAWMVNPRNPAYAAIELPALEHIVQEKLNIGLRNQQAFEEWAAGNPRGPVNASQYLGSNFSRFTPGVMPNFGRLAQAGASGIVNTHQTGPIMDALGGAGRSVYDAFFGTLSKSAGARAVSENLARNFQSGIGYMQEDPQIVREQMQTLAEIVGAKARGQAVDPAVYAQYIERFGNAAPALPGVRGMQTLTSLVSDGLRALAQRTGQAPEAIATAFERRVASYFDATAQTADTAERLAETQRQLIGLHPAETPRFTAIREFTSPMNGAIRLQMGLPVIDQSNLIQRVLAPIRTGMLVASTPELAIRKLFDEGSRNAVHGIYGLNPGDFGLLQKSGLADRLGITSTIAQTAQSGVPIPGRIMAEGYQASQPGRAVVAAGTRETTRHAVSAAFGKGVQDYLGANIPGHSADLAAALRAAGAPPEIVARAAQIGLKEGSHLPYMDFAQELRGKAIGAQAGLAPGYGVHPAPSSPLQGYRRDLPQMARDAFLGRTVGARVPAEFLFGNLPRTPEELQGYVEKVRTAAAAMKPEERNLKLNALREVLHKSNNATANAALDELNNAGLRATKAVGDVEQLNGVTKNGALPPAGEYRSPDAIGKAHYARIAQEYPNAPMTGNTAGWKLHVNTANDLADPTTREIAQYLTDRGLPFKVGSGGEVADGKGMTVYLGPRDLAQNVANDLETHFGSRIGGPAGDSLATNRPFTAHISGRFDTAGDAAFAQYGRNGMPYLTDDARNITMARMGGQPGLPQTVQDAYLRRGDAAAAAKYGDLYTGKNGNGTRPDPRAAEKAATAYSPDIYETPDYYLARAQEVMESGSGDFAEAQQWLDRAKAAQNGGTAETLGTPVEHGPITRSGQYNRNGAPAYTPPNLSASPPAPPQMNGPGLGFAPSMANPGQVHQWADIVQRFANERQALNYGASQAGVQLSNRAIGELGAHSPVGQFFADYIFPFSDFHFNAMGTNLLNFARNPAYPVLVSAYLNQNQDQYGNLPIMGNAVGNLTRLSTGPHMLQYANEMGKYIQDVRQSDNNPLQQAAKIATHPILGNSGTAFLAPFDPIARPLQVGIGKTTNPVLDAKGKPAFGEQVDTSRAYGGATGLLRAGADVLPGVTPGQRSILRNNVAPLIGNPVGTVTGALTDKEVDLANRIPGRSVMPAEKVEYKSLPYTAQDIAGTLGWGDNRARIQGAVDDIFATKGKPTTPDGQQLLNRFNLGTDLNMSKQGLPVNIHSNAPTSTDAYFSGIHTQETAAFNEMKAAWEQFQKTGLVEDRNAYFDAEKRWSAVNKEDKAAPNRPVYASAGIENNPFPNDFPGFPISPAGFDGGENRYRAGTGGVDEQRLDTSRYNTARAQLRDENFVRSDYGRDYLKGFGAPDTIIHGTPSENRTTQANQRLAAQEVNSDIRTGRYLDASDRAKLQDYTNARTAYEGKASAPGSDINVRQLLDQPGNYFDTLNKAEALLRSGNKEQAQRLFDVANDLKNQSPAVHDYFAATETAAKRDDYKRLELRRDDALLNPDTQTALAPLNHSSGAFVNAKTGERAYPTATGAPSARDQSTSSVQRDRLYYDRFNDAQRTAYDRYLALEQSATARNYFDLSGKIPDKNTDPRGFSDWFRNNGDTYNKAANEYRDAMRAIQQSTGVNPLDVANQVRLSEGKSPLGSLTIPENRQTNTNTRSTAGGTGSGRPSGSGSSRSTSSRPSLGYATQTTYATSAPAKAAFKEALASLTPQERVAALRDTLVARVATRGGSAADYRTATERIARTSDGKVDSTGRYSVHDRGFTPTAGTADYLAPTQLGTTHQAVFADSGSQRRSVEYLGNSGPPRTTQTRTTGGTTTNRRKR